MWTAVTIYEHWTAVIIYEQWTAVILWLIISWGKSAISWSVMTITKYFEKILGKITI